MPQARVASLDDIDWSATESYASKPGELEAMQAWSASPARDAMAAKHGGGRQIATLADIDWGDQGTSTVASGTVTAPRGLPILPRRRTDISLDPEPSPLAKLPPVRITARPDLTQPVMLPDPRRQSTPRFEETVNVTAPMPQTTVGSVLKRAGQGLVEGFASPIQDIGSAGASIAYPQMGRTFVEATQAGRPGLEQAGIVAPNLGSITDNWTDPEWWANTLTKAGGSMAGLTAVGALSGGGVGAKALLAAMPEAMAEGASVYNTLRRDGVDHETAVEQAAGVFASNVALLGLTNTPFFFAGAGLFRKALLEGGQEVAQQGVSNVATGRPVGQGMLEAGLIGGVAGGGAHVLGGGTEQPAAVPAPVVPSVVPSGSQRFPEPLAPRIQPPNVESRGEPRVARIEDIVDVGPPPGIGLSFNAPGVEPTPAPVRTPDTEIRSPMFADTGAPSVVAPPDSLRQAIERELGGAVTEDEVAQIAAQAFMPSAPITQPGAEKAAGPAELPAAPEPVPAPGPEPVPAPVQTAHATDVVDILDTGEAQPRLPEAGQVREQNVATPQFEAPFSLSGGFAPTTTRQASIFDQPEPPAAPSQAVPRGTAHVDDVDFAFGQNAPLTEQTAGAAGRAIGARDTEQPVGADEATAQLAKERGPSLMQAVAESGGLKVSDADLQGELSWLKEGSRFGRLGGVANVLRKKGLSPEYMAEAVRERYPALFGHIADGNVLIEQLAHEMRRASGQHARLPAVTAFAEPLPAGNAEPAQSAAASTSLPAQASAGVAQLPAIPTGAGSPTRRVYAEPPQPPNTATPPRKPMSEPAVVSELARIFGHGDERRIFGLKVKSRTPVPVQTGRFGQHAFGIYKVKEQVVRLKKFGDLTTFVHELGHDIDYRVFAGNRPIGLFKGELLALGKETSSKSDTEAYRIAEGVAEFFRAYFANPDEARQRAPAFHQAFQDVLASDPVMKDQFARGTKLVQSYLAQDLATRGAARVDFSGRQDEAPESHMRRLQTQWIDDLAALEHAVDTMAEDKPVDYVHHAYVLARLARGAAGKADGFLTYGLRDEGGQFVGPSFKSAIAGVRDRLEDFGRYLVARRAKELRGRNIEPGMQAGEAAALLAKHQSPEFDAAADALYAFQNGVMDYAVRAGAMTSGQAGAIRKLNRQYVPFWRVMGDRKPSVAKRIAERLLPIHRIKGSGRNVVNPLESIVRNTHAIVDMVEKHRAMQALVQQATSTDGGGLFLEHVPTPQVATKFNLSDLRKDVGEVLKNAGLTVESVMSSKGPTIQVEGQPIDLDELVTIFTPATIAQGKDRVITFMQDGQREFYAVNDPALYDAITAIGPKSAGVLVKLLGAPARVLRAGATLTLGFIGRNPVRDTVVAGVQSKYGFKPGVDTVRGLFSYLKQDELYQQFLNSGAAGAALVSGDRDVLRKELRKLVSHGRIRDHLQDVVFHPIDALRALSEATENATRLGEFRRGLKAEGVDVPAYTAAAAQEREAIEARNAFQSGSGIARLQQVENAFVKTRQAADPLRRKNQEGLTRAALASRDVTVDFSRAGSAARDINQFAAFFNAQIQGYTRLAETFRDHPVGATIRATATVTLVSLALWALNHDDDEYKELPEWEKNTYWHIPLKALGGRGWVKVPKPFELGAIFGNTFEKALDLSYDKDAHAWKRLFVDDPTMDASAVPLTTVKSLAAAVLASGTPTALLPYLEAEFNYSRFRRQHIVSPFDEDLPAELQYNKWTSAIAKTLGKHLDYSPAKIDHLVYGYGAGLARGVVGGAESAIAMVKGGPKAPSGGPARLPGVGAFYKDLAGSDAESLREFYEQRELMRKLPATAERFLSAGETERVAGLKQKYPDRDAKSRTFNAADKRLKGLRDEIEVIYRHPTLDASEKRELLDRRLEAMVNTARVALGKKPLPSRFDKDVDEALERRLRSQPLKLLTR